ncbi:WD40 repeat domain-containing protein, partial [Endozoicomonas sp. ONNA2]|uniref:WD40 repeat domain-containing protein n=1 Tax=Endozoicomonas sp. ONNA2 TaxID=2828741 RepID=UPI002147A6D6
MSYDPQSGKINVLQVDDNGRWTPLNQPKEIIHHPKIKTKPDSFKALNNYLLTYNGTTATIWGCSANGDDLEEKKIIGCNSNIGGAELSNDEQHALIFTQGHQVNFLTRDNDGNWLQIAEVCHPEQNVNHGGKIVPNRICKACFNTSGQQALTRDLAKNSIISGYDDKGAWVEKVAIPPCDYAIFSPAGRKVLACFGKGSFKIWDLHSNDNRLDKSQTLSHINSHRVSFSPSENLLLSYGNFSNYACLWGYDGEGNLVEKARVYHQGGIHHAAFNAREDSVLAISGDCTVTILWCDKDGKWQELVVRHQNNINDARFSSSGNLAFTVSQDHTACILGRDDNGQWLKQAVTEAADYPIHGAQFNKLDN